MAKLAIISATRLDFGYPVRRTSVTRVLVVEDEESFSDPLSYLLRKEGFEVVVSRSPRPPRSESTRSSPSKRRPRTQSASRQPSRSSTSS